ncbi:MAG TPA: hypothetical protein VNH21_05280 [Steroidobacteraceae bacterium]|nr:hypothetical protein [Steroidobacteraceae bacterium]
MKFRAFAKTLGEYWDMPPPRWRSTQPAPEDKMQLGENARRLLDDPVLHAALDRVQQKLIESWRNTAPGEGEAREAAYRLYWASELFRDELRLMLGDARAIEARERALRQDAA